MVEWPEVLQLRDDPEAAGGAAAGAYGALPEEDGGERRDLKDRL